MRITKKKNPIIGDYHIDGPIIESVQQYKDLGLITNSNLTWNAHIDSITAKANSPRLLFL